MKYTQALLYALFILHVFCFISNASTLLALRSLIFGLTACGWFICIYLSLLFCYASRSQWPRGLRRRSADARLLRSWVRIPSGAWIFVCCECCVLSGRGLRYELITHPEESYRLWCVVVCDVETSRMRRP